MFAFFRLLYWLQSLDQGRAGDFGESITCLSMYSSHNPITIVVQWSVPQGHAFNL